LEANIVQSLYNYDSLRGSLPPPNSRSGESDMRSADITVSDLLRFDVKSNSGIDNEDGVWTGQISHRRGDDSSERGGSITPSSAVSARTTGTAWDEIFQAGRPGQTYRPRAESSHTSLTAEPHMRSDKWAKQGAAKPDRGALLAAEKQREEQRKVQEQERARFEEEESSGSEWEL
jgi:hypothetical protein